MTQSAQRRRERRESFVFSRQSGRAVTTPVVPEPRMARYPGPRQRSRRFTPYRLPSRGPGSALRFGRDDGCYCFPVIPAKRHGGCRGARAGIQKPRWSMPRWLLFSWIPDLACGESGMTEVHFTPHPSLPFRVFPCASVAIHPVGDSFLQSFSLYDQICVQNIRGATHEQFLLFRHSGRAISSFSSFRASGARPGIQKPRRSLPLRLTLFLDPG